MFILVVAAGQPNDHAAVLCPVLPSRAQVMLLSRAQVRKRSPIATAGIMPGEFITRICKVFIRTHIQFEEQVRSVWLLT